jgi:hypothetical protein
VRYWEQAQSVIWMKRQDSNCCRSNETFCPHSSLAHDPGESRMRVKSMGEGQGEGEAGKGKI